MAFTYGEGSKYSLWQEKISRLAAKSYFLVLAAGLIWIFFRHPEYLLNPNSILAVFVIFSPLVAFAAWQYIKEMRLARKFQKGRRAENFICRKLVKLLPADFGILENRKSRYGDVDLIVVGPPGVFAIEVKSQSGYVSVRNGEVLIYGRVFAGRNPLKQVKGSALWVKKILGDRITGIVEPILVFASPFASMRLGKRKYDGVYVVRWRFLAELLNDLPPQLSREEVCDLLEYLDKAIDDPHDRAH